MAVDRTRLPAPGPEPSFSFPEITRENLACGLTLWTVEHRELPVLATLLLLPVGSADDPSDLPGLAALTGDMLDEGSGDRSAIEIHDALARIGASFDTDVGVDATVVTLTTLTKHKDRAMALLADIVARPRLAQADFDRVRELRVNRLRQMRDIPSSIADRAFMRLLYGVHPYGHATIGTERSLCAMSIDAMRDFHALEYRPDRVTLIAVGDETHEEIARAVADAFGGWISGSDSSSGSPEDRCTLAAVPTAAGRSVALVPRVGAVQTELRIGHIAVARNTPDYHALVVLNMILGGQFVSRINLNLRQDKGYTYGARSSFDMRCRPGPFVVQASVQTEATVASVREVLAEITGMCGGRPATVAELDTARAALTRGYPRNFETPEQIARAAAQLALYGLSDDHFAQFVPRIAAVGADDIAGAAATHLRPDRLLVVAVGDSEKIRAPLAGLGVGTVEEVAVE